jgi:alkanesulfonate monooxygenase SsuD/methylene tetrahydromethanopterin reductase-like flavin-dependent oxidoreductase (luciferase family)
LQLILMGLTTGELDHRGAYYTFDHVITRLRPLQQPYPPLWYPTSNVESIPWVARNGLSTVFAVHLAESFLKTAEMLRLYRAEYVAHTSDAGRLNGHVAEPRFGFSVHIHVAETDALAQQRARPAYERFMHNFTYRFVRRGQPNRYADRASFDHELERGRVVVGSPATVRSHLQDYVDRSGANYVLGCFSFGSLAIADILDSLDLFAREVMPALQPAGVQPI